MHLDLSPDDLAFRQEVREFLRDNLPEDISRKVERNLHPSRSDCVRWQKILYEQGWAGVNWPVEYGGTGWTPIQKHVWSNECAQAGAPRVIPFGLTMAAPIVWTYGTDEQKRRFLPDILASDVWWCQGYSEPNAGSDLASLTTSAVRNGGSYRVNGTKTWVTLAHYADWIFCLVRTGGAEVKNQEAISFLLIDMASPGVSVRPIITLDGRHEVNEVHFDNVEVPVENRVGEEGSGWTYAKLLLTHERIGIAQTSLSKVRLGELKELAGSLLDDPSFSHRLAELELDLLALEFTELRTLASLSTGKAPGPESSILKLKGSEVAQQIDELTLEVAGSRALPFLTEPDVSGLTELDQGDALCAQAGIRYFNNRKASIYSGSNEIQRSIICKAVLGL